LKAKKNSRARASRAIPAKRPRSRPPRRAADAALELLRAAIEQLNESIAIMDAEDRIVVANRYFRELNPGTSLLDPGNRFEDFLRAGIALGIYPAALGREEAWIEERLACHRRGGTLEVQRQDGKWLLVTDQRLPDGGMITFALDITARKNAEEALRQSEARFRSLADLSSDWYWEQDADLRFVSTSGRESGRGGITAADHTGRRRWELPGTETVNQSWGEHQATLAAHEPFRDVLLRRTAADGAVYYVNISGEPMFNAQGEFSGYRGIARDVTERVVAEKLAHAADERLRHAIEHLNESIAIVDADDRIVVANRYFRELNGGTRLAEPGHLYAEHLRAGIPLGNYPEAAGREETWLEERIARHRRGGTVEVKRQDGKWLLVTDQRLPDGGMISFALDITERKKTELALAESESHLRAIFDQAAVGIALRQTDGHWIQVNQRLCEILGYTREELLATTSVELTPPDERGIAIDYNQRIARGEIASYVREKRYLRKDGSAVWVNISVNVAHRPGGSATHTVTVVEDISARKEAEQQARAADERLREALRDTNEELERRVAERTAALQTAYRELESFSYSVSHDLRSPLGVIASFAGILARQEAGRISEDGMRLVSVIDENAQRMGRLIDALLELMRMSRRELVSRRLDMAKIAGAICRDLQRDYPLARIEIGELPAARGDEMLVHQVLANLVGNALKFSSKAALQNVEVGAEAGTGSRDGAPVYFVRDNGAGFDTVHAAKLFKPFERLHSEDEFPGTGIGLALVQLIVQRHGGRIWAESAPGRGSTFRFTLAGGGPG
jgi:PAS domain S-box-containing protein